MKLFRTLGAIALLCISLAVPAFAAPPSVTLALPASIANANTVTGRSGTLYTPNAQGQITVTNSPDTLAFEAAGAVVIPGGSSVVRLPLVQARNSDGSVVTASAAAGKFGTSITLGTSEALSGEAATGNTKTDAAIYEVILPPAYVATQNLTVTVHAQYNGAGTAGTATVAVVAYPATDAGVLGAAISGVTAAQTITGTDAAYAFIVPGATFTPGTRLVLKITAVMQETGGSASVTAAVDSVSLQ